MNPRALDPPHPEFAPALEPARLGRFEEALGRVEATLGPDRSEPRLIAAGTALLAIARLAETAGERAHERTVLEHALALRPGWADLHFARARACLALGQRGEARVSLDRALRINPRYLAARVERALLDAREGFVGEALDALRALAEEARVAEPRGFQQGIEAVEQGDWDGAGGLLRRALRLAEPDLEARMARFRDHMQAGESAEAVQLLRDALPRHDGYPDLHAMLGAAELALGQVDDAIASFARALELNPDFGAARLQLARALDAAGLRSQALEQVALVLQVEPDQPEALALEQEWSARHAGANARDWRARKDS